MNNALLIFLAVVVISAIIGGLAQMLKNVQKAEETRSARARSTSRERSERSGSGDIDRFMEEIDKLRRRGGVEPPVARSIAAPPVPAQPRTRIIDRPSITLASRPVPTSRLEELPVAPVVTSPPAVARRAPAPGRSPVPRSEFARGLFALLKSQYALPTAVVLHEVLGPPRSRQR